MGKTYKTLVTGHDGLTYIGRTEMEAPDSDGEVHFFADDELQEGSFVNVRITRADTYDLYGEIAD